MGIILTGHAEIDHQHAILDGMVDELARFCAEMARDKDASCDRCGIRKRQRCGATLGAINRELRAFLVGHATYEERMMELLPRTAICRAHVKGHKAAHAGIAKQLARLAPQIDKECPRLLAARLEGVVREWMGDHATLFDDNLVRQLSPRKASEIDLDGELVAILDEYVFHNRPTGPRGSLVPERAIDRKKLEVRGRFELLSPAQREVFWLVVNGSKNSEIADALGISINTVKSHRAAVFQKMEVNSVLDLVKKTDVLRRGFRK
ncbi:MAG: hemerythrin domain-containing protein [Rhodocyclales bacterium]|nr:hemerythrin domain-containing protein [Rhodocyclales bacterium]